MWIVMTCWTIVFVIPHCNFVPTPSRRQGFWVGSKDGGACRVPGKSLSLVELHYVRGWPAARGCRCGFGYRDSWPWWRSHASCAVEGPLVLQLLQSWSHSNKKFQGMYIYTNGFEPIFNIFIPKNGNHLSVYYTVCIHVWMCLWTVACPCQEIDDKIEVSSRSAVISTTLHIFWNRIWLWSYESKNSSQCFHLPRLPAPEVKVPEETPETIPVRPDTIVPFVNVP